MLPVTEEAGTLEMADLANTAKLPAVPNPTAAGPLAMAQLQVGAAPTLLLQDPTPQPPLFVLHSSISAHTCGAPNLLLQVLYLASPQPPLFVLHSSISAHTCGAPTLLLQVLYLASPQPPLLLAHSSMSEHVGAKPMFSLHFQ